MLRVDLSCVVSLPRLIEIWAAVVYAVVAVLVVIVAVVDAVVVVVVALLWVVVNFGRSVCCLMLFCFYCGCRCCHDETVTEPQHAPSRVEVAASCRLTAVCWSSLAARLLKNKKHEVTRV